jgi:hypothetical protein
MTTKQEAKAKVTAATKGCEAAEKAWQDAYTALSGSVSTNGYGIHHNRYELRDKLLQAGLYPGVTPSPRRHRLADECRIRHCRVSRTKNPAASPCGV